MRRTAPLTPKEIQDCHALRAEGYTHKEIAEEVGISHASVARALTRAPAKSNGKTPKKGIPVEKIRYNKGKALVPTAYACPHCGGKINA
jgi:orotate phosphoribosyltransferase-like protein